MASEEQELAGVPNLSKESDSSVASLDTKSPSGSDTRQSFDFGVLTHWFFPVVGGIYAAGYLIVVTFARDFGIEGTELLQAKYVHVGSLFLFSCLILILPLFWICRSPFG